MAQDTPATASSAQVASTTTSTAINDTTTTITSTSQTAVPGTTNIDADIPDPLNQLPPLPSLPPPHPSYIAAGPPTAPIYNPYSVFLAGSIEMGAAVQWQRHLTAHLRHLPLTICNPRRGFWNTSTTPSAANAAFREQVEWELAALESVSVIAFFFDEATKSPVSLLELGLWARSGKVVVCCGDGFWRAGNVRITCERYEIPVCGRFEEFPGLVTKMLGEKGLKVEGEA